MGTHRLPALTDRSLIASFLGLGDEGGPCPLPGHHGCADLAQCGGGVDLWLVCDCTGHSAQWDHRGTWRSEYHLCLADVYWSIRTGEVIGRGFKLKAGLRLVARLLLTAELALIDPVQVELPAIPRHLPAAYHEVRDFFGLLYGLRMADNPERVQAEGIACSEALLVAWLGLTRTQARVALLYLRNECVIEQIGRDGERGPFLYAPCSVSVHHGAGAQPSDSQRARS